MDIILKQKSYFHHIESEHCLGSLVCRCPFGRFGPFVHSGNLTLFDISDWCFWGVLKRNGAWAYDLGSRIRCSDKTLGEKNEPAFLKQSSCKQLWTVLGDLLSLLLLLPLLAPFTGLPDFNPILLLSAVLASPRRNGKGKDQTLGCRLSNIFFPVINKQVDQPHKIFFILHANLDGPINFLP